MAPDFGGKPFSLAHYLSVRSAVSVNQPEQAVFHFQYEPSGEWWERAKPLLTLNRIKAPGEIMGKKLCHVAHQADVVRLQALIETGGVYLDLDTISVRPLTEHLSHRFVIGQEMPAPFVIKNWRQRVKHLVGLGGHARKETGLCNAVLLSEKNSGFATRWLAEYKSFRSTGLDKYWSEHSVFVPQRLAAEFPELLTILGPRAFHYPLYDTAGLRSMFEEAHDFPEAYLHHLWESFAWEKYMSKLTVHAIMNTDTTYNRIARKYL